MRAISCSTFPSYLKRFPRRDPVSELFFRGGGYTVNGVVQASSSFSLPVYLLPRPASVLFEPAFELVVVGASLLNFYDTRHFSIAHSTNPHFLLPSREARRNDYRYFFSPPRAFLFHLNLDPATFKNNFTPFSSIFLFCSTKYLSSFNF